MRKIQLDRRELQYIIDAAARANREQDNAPRYFYGFPTEIVRSDYRARYNDQVLASPRPGTGLTVHLPSVSTRDIGKPITVSNITSNVTDITVQASPGATIEGERSIVMTQSYDSLVLIPVTETLWVSKVSSVVATPANVTSYTDRFNGTTLDATRWHVVNNNGTISLDGSGHMQLQVPASTVADWWLTASTCPLAFYRPQLGIAPHTGVLYGEVKAISSSMGGANAQFGLAITHKPTWSAALNVRAYYVAFDEVGGTVDLTDIGGSVLGQQTSVSAPTVSTPHYYRVYVNASGADRTVTVGAVSVTLESGAIWGTWSVDGGTTWYNTPTSTINHFPTLKSTTTIWGDMTFSFAPFLKVWSSYGSASTALLDNFTCGVV